jgi:mRNA interferase YafQ
MLNPVTSSKFKQDVKRIIRQGKDTARLKLVLERLIEEIPLDPAYKDHRLTGDMKDFRECHIEPDWLLVYKIEGKEIYLARTGSHSELFKK